MHQRKMLKLMTIGSALLLGLFFLVSPDLFGQASGASKEAHILYSSSSHGYFDTCG